MKTNEELSEMAKKMFPILDHEIGDVYRCANIAQLRAGYRKGYQAAQEDMKWIDCKDRLPEKIYTETSERVLVWQKNKTYISAYNHTQNFWETNYEDKITHWMPLPQKPLIP